MKKGDSYDGSSIKKKKLFAKRTRCDKKSLILRYRVLTPLSIYNTIPIKQQSSPRFKFCMFMWLTKQVKVKNLKYLYWKTSTGMLVEGLMVNGWLWKVVDGANGNTVMQR